MIHSAYNFIYTLTRIIRNVNNSRNITYVYKIFLEYIHVYIARILEIPESRIYSRVSIQISFIYRVEIFAKPSPEQGSIKMVDAIHHAVAESLNFRDDIRRYYQPAWRRT